MIRTSRFVFGAACALGIGAVPLLAQQDLGRDGTSWQWDGALPSGGSIRLYNINGALHFTPSPNASVHVQAEKHVHSGGDPKTVHYAVVRDGNNLTICALWNDNARCDANGMHGNERSDGDNRDRRRNVTAEISVQVPAGVQTSGNTINGDVSVERVASDIRANTVNGTIRVSQVTGQVRARTVNGDVNVDTRGGPVSAETVNGSVTASMGATGTSDMRFRTVNGDIEITTPSSLNAEVELSTLNGSIDTKYALDFDRNRHHARGTLGNGNRQLSASTVSGSITLH
jgi:putative adhesin